MVCGRVNRTNALQKCSTASSGEVPLLRSEPVPHSVMFSCTPQQPAAEKQQPHRLPADSESTPTAVAKAADVRSRCVWLSKGQRRGDRSAHQVRLNSARRNARCATLVRTGTACARPRMRLGSAAHAAAVHAEGQELLQAGRLVNVSVCRALRRNARRADRVGRTAGARRTRCSRDGQRQLLPALRASTTSAVRSGEQHTRCRRHRRRCKALLGHGSWRGTVVPPRSHAASFLDWSSGPFKRCHTSSHPKAFG